MTTDRKILRPNADGWRNLLPAVALLLASTVAIGMAHMLPDKNSRQVAALFNPFWGTQATARAVAASGVRMVRTGALDTILVVDLDRTGSPARLYRAGAWLVLDAVAAQGCGAGTTGRNA